MAIASRKLNRHLALHLNPTTPAIHHRFSPYPATSSSLTTHHQEVKSLTELEKLHPLGQGSGGAVFKVRHKPTRAIYALKKISSSAAAAETQEEVSIHRIASSSPHVVKFQGSFQTPNGDVSILMDYMESGSLSDHAKASYHDARLPEHAIADVARQILQGFSHLHANNIVHRDVKPSNFLVNNNNNNEVKIADFGVSKRLPTRLARCDSYVGTAAYLSPERFDMAAHGSTYDGFAADVWSLGLVFLELYLGRYPLLEPGQKPDWPALMCAICFGEMPPKIPEEASEEFKEFIGCCLEKDPCKRWTVQQLLGHRFIVRRPEEEEERTQGDS
ncbi:unnamed protein product [Linum trigynum]|uniref:Protein kinase domain-containing protein n=1 Tax=Linum trigynum TaxID=586398 RepID=A0AAV2C978_9ROSI